MHTGDSDRGYNKYIAQKLGLDEGFDFMNDSEAIHVAEEEISNRGLNIEYLQALNKMGTFTADKTTLKEFSTQKPGFKALAIVKMLQEGEQ